jgi:glucose-6-phosphate isomerase
MDFMEPFKTVLNMDTGALQPVGNILQRRLSDMHSMFADAEALAKILAREGDRLIYEVYAVDLPETEGLLLYSTTIIYPGRIGAEFHMTKGHFHEHRDRAELYLGLTGEGYLLLQTEDGTTRCVPMGRGTVAYVPPYWAHRTVNTGDAPFSFLAVWPGDAGHDYGTIEQTGFAKLLVARDSVPTLVDNQARPAE